MTIGALLFLALILGLIAAAAALVIRRAETALPDPADIHTRTGLAHMMTGIIAWAALISLMVVATFVGGLILPAITAAATAFALFRNWGARLTSLYRTQLPLAATALLIAITEWLYLITLMQLDPYQIR